MALGGDLGGHVRVRGAPPDLALAAQLAWRGYHTAEGQAGTTTVDIAATASKLDANVMYGPLAITIGAVRTGDHVAITARTAAADTPLLAVLPALPHVRRGPGGAQRRARPAYARISAARSS